MNLFFLICFICLQFSELLDSARCRYRDVILGMLVEKGFRACSGGVSDKAQVSAAVVSANG